MTLCPDNLCPFDVVVGWSRAARLEGLLARRTLAELREARSEPGGWLGGKLPEEQLDQLHLARSDAVVPKGVDEVAEACVERAADPYRQVGERFIGQS